MLQLEVTDVTEDSITLQWKPPANSDLVPVERYEVTRDVSFRSDEQYFVSETTFTDSGLRSGEGHKYRVRAIGTGGIEGAETSIEEFTLGPATPEPTPVPAVTDTPVPAPTDTPIPDPAAEQPPMPTHTPVPAPSVVQQLEVIDITEGSITLRWKPPANSGVVPVERYEVTRGVSFRPDEHHFVSETTFTDVGLRSGEEFKYRVRAIGTGGIEGAEVSIAWSTPDSATPEPTRNAAPEPVPTDTPQPASVPGPTMWRGLVVADENRCSPYDSDDYPYSQTVEGGIVAELGGIVYGPYTGTYFSSTRETDIEHIVARSEAHDSGLCAAGAETRRRFASDLLNLTLASPSVNRQQKSAKDVAEWLPDLNQCWYVDRTVRVRQEYGLTIDQREVDALETVISGCSSFEMVVVPALVTGSPAATHTPTPSSSSDVDALAMWDDDGNGRISCAEARSHSIAPVHRGHPAYEYMDDRDNDGVVCE